MKNIVIAVAIVAAIAILTARPVFTMGKEAINADAQIELSGKYIMSARGLDLGYFEFQNGEFEHFKTDGSSIRKGTIFVEDGFVKLTTNEGILFVSGKVTPDGKKIYLHKDGLESGITIKKVE